MSENSKSLPGFNKIIIDPNILNGQPCLAGQRLTVHRVLEILALYPDRAELRQEYPELEEEHIKQVLTYAAQEMTEQNLYLSAIK